MTTVNDRSSGPNDCTPERSPTIRFPKWAWNSFEPQHHSPTRRATRSTTSGQTSTKLPTIHDDRDEFTNSTTNALVHEEVSITPSAQHRSCKTKLWGFHYGGPKRGVRGAMQNEITYESPCLQPTCANCLKWQPHLMRGQSLVGELPSEDAPLVDRVDMEPLSPEIDPRILNNTWQNYTSWGDNANSTASLTLPDPNASPVLTPVKLSFVDATSTPEVGLPLQHDIDNTPPHQQCNVTLPIPLANKAVYAAPLETNWRDTPRHRPTVRLLFSSHLGKQKFRELVIKREKKAIYDRARRARLQRVKEQMGRKCS